jgi:uncharacterized damage-inducible protein DinB
VSRQKWRLGGLTLPDERISGMTWTAPPEQRIDEPFTGDERAMLEGLLDWQRQTLLHKCAGLTGEQLALRSTPPSTLCLLGLIRHLTDVERHWFRRRFAGHHVELLYARDDHPDNSFDDIDPARAEEEYDRLVDEWDQSRRTIAELPLDLTYLHDRYGPMSLRWGILHMIEEYARHNGQADLLRERIDGVKGS